MQMTHGMHITYMCTAAHVHAHVHVPRTQVYADE